MGILSREGTDEVLGAAWPLAARAAAGLCSPGGAGLMGRALAGAGIDRGSRVVDLEAGLGLGAQVALERVPRTWTGLDGDALAVSHLTRAYSGAGRRSLHAPPEDTGLEGGCASVVVVDGALCLRDEDAAAALLAEAARLLCTSGRVVVVEPVPAERGGESLRAAGVRVRPVADLRRMLRDAGLVGVGDLDAPLCLRSPHSLARAAGPRTALRLARGAADERVRRAATVVRQALDAESAQLRAGAVVAERPLVMGFRRPR